MNKNMIIAAILAASVAGIGSASAQDRHDNGRRDAPGQMKKDDRHDNRNDNRYDRSDERRNDRADYRHDDRHDDRRDDHRDARNDDRRDYRGAGPRHDLRKGGRLPPEYRSRQYVVNDWRGHRLSAPPRGYHWVQTGSDYVLVAITTGVIASLLLSN